MDTAPKTRAKLDEAPEVAVGEEASSEEVPVAVEVALASATLVRFALRMSKPAVMVTGAYKRVNSSKSSDAVKVAVGWSSSLPPMLIVVHFLATLLDMSQCREKFQSSTSGSPGMVINKSSSPVLAAPGGRVWLAQGPRMTVLLYVPQSFPSVPKGQFKTYVVAVASAPMTSATRDWVPYMGRPRDVEKWEVVMVKV